MEFFVDVAQLIGQKMVEASAKALETPEAQKAFDRRIRFIAEVFAILILIISILLPAYFFILPIQRVSFILVIFMWA